MKVDALFAKNPAVENRTMINGYSLIDSQYKSNVATFFRDAQGLQGALFQRQSAPRRRMPTPC